MRLPFGKLLALYLLLAAGLVAAAFLLRMAWRVAASLFTQDDVVERAGLVARGELREGLRLPGPASSHRAHEGTLDGCRVTVRLMLGSNKGTPISRTEVVVAAPRGLLFGGVGAGD